MSACITVGAVAKRLSATACLVAIAASMTAAALPAPANAALSEARYEQLVTRASEKFARAGQSFKRSVSTTSTLRSAGIALERLQSDTYEAALDVAVLDPPPRLYQANRSMALALRAIGAACEPSIRAARRGSRRAFIRELRVFQRRLNGSLGDRAKAAASRIDRLLSQ